MFSIAAEEYDRAISIAALTARKEEAKTRRKKKKKTASSTSLASNTFHELYRLTGEVLGQGAYASVQTCVNIYTDVEYAVKIIDKVPTHSRARVFKEIDLFHHCQVLLAARLICLRLIIFSIRVIQTSYNSLSTSRRRNDFT